MGKKALSWVFIAFLIASIYIFFSKDDKDLRDSVRAVSSSVPRVTLKNFEIKKYNSLDLKLSTTAKLAYFIEPDILEVYGDIFVMEKTDAMKSIAMGDTLTAYFNSNGLVDLTKKGEIKKAILENNVKLYKNNTRISSNIVSYLAQSRVISSDRIVEIESTQGELIGENGFAYDLDDEFLKLFGPVKGLLNGDTIKEINR